MPCPEIGSVLFVAGRIPVDRVTQRIYHAELLVKSNRGNKLPQRQFGL